MSLTGTSEPSQQWRPATASPPYGDEARAAAPPRLRKKRVRNFTADDRAAHRVFEKGRREAFRERLLALAELLPALEDARPQSLSKHVVVEESTRHIVAQRAQLDATYSQIRALVRERSDVLAELNQWRSQAGLPVRQPEHSGPVLHQQVARGSLSEAYDGPCRGTAFVDDPVGLSSGADEFPVLAAVPVSTTHPPCADNTFTEPCDLMVPLSTLILHQPPTVTDPGRLDHSLALSGLKSDGSLDYNTLLQPLQPGSSLGPAAYAPANDHGLPVHAPPSFALNNNDYMA